MKLIPGILRYKNTRNMNEYIRWRKDKIVYYSTGKAGTTHIYTVYSVYRKSIVI